MKIGFAAGFILPSPYTGASITVQHSGAVRCGAVRCGAVRCGAVRCGAVRCGAVRCGAVRCGAVRCGAVRCGAVRCGAVRCGAVRCGAVRYIGQPASRTHECRFFQYMKKNCKVYQHSKCVTLNLFHLCKLIAKMVYIFEEMLTKYTPSTRDDVARTNFRAASRNAVVAGIMSFNQI